MTKPLPDELRPCPFCGGRNINFGYIRDGKTLSCRACGAQVHAFHGPQPGSAEAGCRAKWNARVEHAMATLPPIATDPSLPPHTVEIRDGNRVVARIDLRDIESEPADAPDANLDALFADSERRKGQRRVSYEVIEDVPSENRSGKDRRKEQS